MRRADARRHHSPSAPVGRAVREGGGAERPELMRRLRSLLRSIMKMKMASVHRLIGKSDKPATKYTTYCAGLFFASGKPWNSNKGPNPGTVTTVDRFLYPGSFPNTRQLNIVSTQSRQSQTKIRCVLAYHHGFRTPSKNATQTRTSLIFGMIFTGASQFGVRVPG